MSKIKDRITIRRTRKGVTTIRASGRAAELLFRAMADNRREDATKKTEVEAPKTDKGVDE